MKFLARIAPSLAFLTPALALAQFGEVDTFFGDVISFMNNTLVPLVFAVAFLVFIWGVFQYFILGAGDETKRETGKSYMLYGIIGFVVMVSVWGIVNLLSSGLGFDSPDIQNIPNLPTDNN